MHQSARLATSLNNSASSPLWCIDIMMSEPPTNSPLTYNCGIVGHAEYALIPFLNYSLASTFLDAYSTP